MSKRVARKGKRRAEKTRQKSRRKPVVIICSLLILTLSIGVMAQWKILPGISKPFLLSPAPQGSLSANSPSKEYIYAGGRLIATEEPQASASSPTPTPTPTPLSGEYVIWRRPLDVSASPGTLTKTGTVSGWNAGASSTRALNGDGYLEFKASAANTDLMVGLNNADLDYGFTELDYAIYLTGYGKVAVYQSGISSGVVSDYAAGDTFRISTGSTAIRFLRNGTEFYSINVMPTYPLVVDTTLASAGAGITNAVLSGTLIDVPGTENVVWTNAVDVSVSGNSLTKTGTVAGWNAGASSNKAIASGNGYVEFTATEANTDRMFGLNSVDADQGFTELKYGIYLTGYGGVAIYHSGASSGQVGTYVAGDVFRISIDNGTVTYRKNGAVFYTSSVAPTYPLRVDTSMATTGSTVTNVVISGNLTP